MIFFIFYLCPLIELENEIDNDQDRLQKYKENIDQLNVSE